MRHPAAAAIALCAALAVVAGPDAHAQDRPRGPLTPESAFPRERPPPPALPGLAARPAPGAIPSDASQGALSPNAALFDAINRGDIAAAREAMARGADLDARNALGLAPIDAAVDQGRNDIAFYLLSARATARVAGPPPDAGGSPPPPSGRGSREAAARERREAAAAQRVERAAAAEAARRDRAGSARVERQASSGGRAERAPPGGGGTPRPESGFLGFDGRGGG